MFGIFEEEKLEGGMWYDRCSFIIIIQVCILYKNITDHSNYEKEAGELCFHIALHFSQTSGQISFTSENLSLFHYPGFEFLPNYMHELRK